MNAMIKNVIGAIVEFSRKIGLDWKSLIIGVLIPLVFYTNNGLYESTMRSIIKNDAEIKKSDKIKAEEWTINQSDNINKQLESIASKDHSISNVVLCNYHDNQPSNVDFSYYYFTSLTEALGNRTYEVLNVWHERSYVNYRPELKSIHKRPSMTICVEKEKDLELYPKLCNLIIESKAKTAIFVPITGMERPIGLVVILFGEAKSIDQYTYIYNIDKEIRELSLSLNYRHQYDKANG